MVRAHLVPFVVLSSLVAACGNDDALQAQVDDLEQRMIAQEAATAGNDLDVQEERIDALEGVDVGYESRIDQLETTIGAYVDKAARIDAELGAMKNAVAKAEATVETLETALDTAQSRITILEGLVEDLEDEIATEHSTVLLLSASLDAIEADYLGASDYGSLVGLADYLTVDATNDRVVLSGANLYVQSGSGSTDGAVNGLGNLIIGYDEDAFAKYGTASTKTGSHNLVIGAAHDYTSYGGFLAGEFNGVTAPYASVGGGFDNAASGDWSVVSGGRGNTASSDYAVDSGG